MKIQGKILIIGETVAIGTKGFVKRILILETDSQYPQPIQIEFTKEDVSLLDDLDVGESIVVHFNINGRKWVSPSGDVKYFNSLVGWKLDSIQASENYENKPPLEFNRPEKKVETTTTEIEDFDDLDDVPF